MEIYFSIPKGFKPATRSKILNAFISHDREYYRGGDYKPSLLDNCDTCILLLSASSQDVIGRGQYEELNRSALQGKKPKAVWLDPDTNFLHLYEIEDAQPLPQKNWKEYASLEVSLLAEYTGAEIDDYYSNGFKL